MALRRKLGYSAVLALVVGDVIGSGIFFTPGQLAAVASDEWQVYFIWTLCGGIALCGALTLAELSVLLPKPGVAYHALTEAYGRFAGFLQAWIMVLVSGPGAIAGIAILFGELANRIFGTEDRELGWAVAAIVVFAAVNLRGAEWGGRTQIVLTSVKLCGLVALVFGAVGFAPPADALRETDVASGIDPFALLRFLGLGVAIVLFTYDGWIDASNVAGEVKDPGRSFPLAMGLGVTLVIAVYLLVNYAFLSVLTLAEMRAEPALVAATVAEAAFGKLGGGALNALICISILGALGGLILTLPRLYYAAARAYAAQARSTRMAPFFNGVASLTERTAVPAGAILFACGMSLAALIFFGTFSRIVTFFLVPFQFMNILMVSTIFRLRPRLSTEAHWRMPLFPLLPLVFMSVMSVFLIAAIVFNPLDSVIGVALTLLGIPVYRALADAPADSRT